MSETSVVARRLGDRHEARAHRIRAGRVTRHVQHVALDPFDESERLEFLGAFVLRRSLCQFERPFELAAHPRSVGAHGGEGGTQRMRFVLDGRRRCVGPREDLVAQRAHRVLPDPGDQRQRRVGVVDGDREALCRAQIGERPVDALDAGRLVGGLEDALGVTCEFRVVVRVPGVEGDARHLVEA